ncbi:hypothetical protein BW733_11675 [Tessaracoccus flavescens]|uniref:Uncharacterized protein n=1 Tax=Tessaracoccus flavescens TaxID=399497 RepID=A0A1Q2CZ46_9ACTN|nr:hypothetical protein BW733_11675 [Tessaracoccus flavescens]
MGAVGLVVGVFDGFVVGVVVGEVVGVGVGRAETDRSAVALLVPAAVTVSFPEVSRSSIVNSLLMKPLASAVVVTTARPAVIRTSSPPAKPPPVTATVSPAMTSVSDSAILGSASTSGSGSGSAVGAMATARSPIEAQAWPAVTGDTAVSLRTCLATGARRAGAPSPNEGPRRKSGGDQTQALPSHIRSHQPLRVMSSPVRIG